MRTRSSQHRWPLVRPSLRDALRLAVRPLNQKIRLSSSLKNLSDGHTTPVQRMGCVGDAGHAWICVT
jgi:hypothetical protein